MLALCPQISPFFVVALKNSPASLFLGELFFFYGVPRITVLYLARCISGATRGGTPFVDGTSNLVFFFI